ncbi:MAG: hypothetical protein ACRDVW_09895 [Acidimicrobiales bacterium]
MAPNTASEQPAKLRVVRWDHPDVEHIGADPRSLYAERFWLPVLGPSAIWFLRRVADLFEEQPDVLDLDLDGLARALGLGASRSRHSPLRRAIARCVHFDVARPVGAEALAVRPLLPPLTARHLIRLSLELQEQHRVWEAERSQDDGSVRLRRRARLVALDLRDLGVDDACIERHLLRRGVHPATAFEAARWAWSPQSDADRPVAVGGHSSPD